MGLGVVDFISLLYLQAHTASLVVATQLQGFWVLSPKWGTQKNGHEPRSKQDWVSWGNLQLKPELAVLQWRVYLGS